MKNIYTLIVLLFASFSLDAQIQTLKNFEVGNPNDEENYGYLKEFLPLREYVDREKFPNFRLGNAVSVDDYLKHGDVYDMENNYYDEVVAGNAMKMGSCVDNDGVMNFETVKDFVNDAYSKGLKIYGHTLGWHEQQPVVWLNSLLIKAPTEEDGVVVEEDRRCLVLASSDKKSEVWESQFWLLLGDFDEGDSFEFSADIRSDLYKASTSTEIHSAPGEYVGWEALGEIEFSDKWNRVVKSGTFKSSGKSIAFNLNFTSKANKYYFDNISFKVNGEERIKNGDLEGTDVSSFKYKNNTGNIKNVEIYKHISCVEYPDPEELSDEEKRDTLIYALEQWIGGIMEATDGKVKAWDVVNEAIADYWNVSYKDFLPVRNSCNDNSFIWQNYMGDLDYVRQAVRIAREKYAKVMEKHGGDDGNLKLFINDYSLEDGNNNNIKLRSLIKWIERWEADGETRIDGIGSQMHISCYANDNALESAKRGIENSFRLMAQTGKLVRISELDICMVGRNGSKVGISEMTEDYHHIMSDYYEWIVKKYLEIIPVEQQWGICQWGAYDSPPSNVGWLPDSPCGIFTVDGYRKHAYAGYVRGLVSASESETPADNILTNGDASTKFDQNISSTDADKNYTICAWSKENAGSPHPADIELVDGDRVFVVHAADCADPTADASAWDNQFWIQAPREFHTGDTFSISFRYKASKVVTTNTQVHSQFPGDYLYWEGIGDVSFTTGWKHFEKEITVSEKQDGMWSIAFNLNSEVKTATDFYFDDLCWNVLKEDEPEDFVKGSKIVINEIMQSNIDCVMDDLNDFPDSWVELYNAGDVAVDLSTYRLGVKDKYKKADQLPAYTLKPGAFAVVYCDKATEDWEAYKAPGKRDALNWHMSFRLESAKDCKLYLFDGDKNIVDSLPAGMKKQPAPNIAFGRKKDGQGTVDDWNYQLVATPGAKNCGKTVSNKKILGNPVFSVAGKIFRSGSFDVELSLPEGTPEGTVIRYTTDFTEPTADSQEYTEPISVSETTIIKAKLFCDGMLSPWSTTQSYIKFDRNVTLPIFSIVTDENYLYDPKIGIYTDGEYSFDGSDESKNFFYNWRRPMNFELFDGEETESAINQLGEVRIGGAYTRREPLKTFTVYANKRFGEKRLKYEFFPDQRPGINDYKSILLRNAGNDFNCLYMRDAIIQCSMAKYLDLDWQAWRPSIVFVNGKYWGMLNIRERSNEDNIYSNYKDEKGDGLEDVDMVENWWELKEGNQEAWDAFQSFYSEKGHTYKEYDQIMDVQEFMDVMIMNSVFCNLDFPGNNMVWWKPQAEGSRWRVLVKDTDFGLGLYSRDLDTNFFYWLYNPEDGSANQYDHTRLYRRLMDDADFKREFIDRCAIYMGDFINFDRVWETWEPMYEMVKEELEIHRNKYPGWSSYSSEMASAKSWLKQRPSYVYRHLSSYFELGSPVKLNIDKNADDISVTFNGVKLSRGTFDGMFFSGRQFTLEGENVDGWAVIEKTPFGNITNTVEGRKLEYTISADCSSVKIVAYSGEYEPEEESEGPVYVWKNILKNGTADDDFGDEVSAWGKENGGSPHPANIETLDGERVFVVHAGDKFSDPWDNQFWIQAPHEFYAGDSFRISFRYKASKNVTVTTEVHRSLGNYLHWEAIGDVQFNTEWQTFEREIVLNADQSGMSAITFTLNSNNETAADFYFDDLCWMVNEEIDPAEIQRQTIAVSSGWTWISTCMEDGLPLKPLFDNDVTRVLTQTQESIVDKEYGPVGSIKFIEPGIGYKVQSSKNFDITIIGNLQDISSSPIVLKKGWNWIPYPYNESRDIADIILYADNEDIITSQEGFAEYKDGNWEGTLTTLNSGSSYIYKSVSDKSLEFEIKENPVKAKTRTNTDANEPEYGKHVDIHKYPNTMNIIAKIFDESGKEWTEECCVYALCGNEIRGIGKKVNDNYYITVYGDEQVDVNFVVEVFATGETYLTRKNVVFDSEVIGSRKSPYQIVVGEQITGLDTISCGEQSQKIYRIDGTLIQGKKLNTLPKGIYIIGGKKYIK